MACKASGLILTVPAARRSDRCHHLLWPLPLRRSDDFLSCNPYSSRPPLVRWISLCLCLLHLLFRCCPLLRCWTSVSCATLSDLIASVCSFCSSVQTPQSGLLQFRSHLRQPCHLLSFRARPQRLRDRALAAFTLWNTQFHELYSPFKAHTKSLCNGWVMCKLSVFIFVQRVFTLDRYVFKSQPLHKLKRWRQAI